MKKVYIERQSKFLRIAIKENDILTECFIDEENLIPRVGEIYKGKVKNVVPAIKCAFIDIGYVKNCYLYLDRKFNNTKFKKGDDVLVEIVKEETGGKGPKVTNAISIPGRYAVLLTMNNVISFSEKIKDDNFKLNILNCIIKPEGIGLMIRTNSVNVSLDDIQNEIIRLNNIYLKLLSSAEYELNPKLLYADKGVIDKVFRDNIDIETRDIYVNDIDDFNQINEYLVDKTEIKCRVELYASPMSLFSFYNIEKEILALRKNKVVLKCGGYIIIDKTEAMYVIDVNSGKNVIGTNIKETVYITNMEAASEIGRQIKLRNLAGIIVIDFIDMDDISNKNDVILELNRQFEKDKNKTIVFPFTELNLVQIARRRRGKSINEYIEEDCTSCCGRGKKVKFSYIKSLLYNDVIRICSDENIKNILIEMNILYENEVNEDIKGFMNQIGALGKSVYIKYRDNLEYYNVKPLMFANILKENEQFLING